MIKLSMHITVNPKYVPMARFPASTASFNVIQLQIITGLVHNLSGGPCPWNIVNIQVVSQKFRILRRNYFARWQLICGLQRINTSLGMQKSILNLSTRTIYIAHTQGVTQLFSLMGSLGLCSTNVSCAEEVWLIEIRLRTLLFVEYFGWRVHILLLGSFFNGG